MGPRTQWLSRELVQCLIIMIYTVSAEVPTPAVFGEGYTAGDKDDGSKRSGLSY